MFRPPAAYLVGLICLLAGGGCAARVPYQYGHFRSDQALAIPPDLAGGEVEFGKPHKVLDGIARVIGLPARVVGLNKKINNHEVSLATIAKLRTYLAQNDLSDVMIYVNCYDPSEQWRRLKENQQIGAGWRYSLGALSVVSYTLLPGRIFGGDEYNPYTNSLYLNSDVPAIALYEGAFAKNVHRHKWRGTYTAFSGLPGASLVRGSHEVGDVLGYAQVQHDWPTERQAYYVLYPQVGAQTASLATPIVPVWWAVPMVGLGGAAVGHVTGRMVAHHREGQVDPTALAESDEGEEEPDDDELPPPGGVELATPADSP
ncbi:MAG TPA: hypothetical protein VMF30_02380 [Pirellulales bacterium]|nr:hypothetical protein [Pirellulales bacterium]